jgi:hypothetical protein
VTVKRILVGSSILGFLSLSNAFASPAGRVGQLGMIEGSVTVDTAPAKNGQVVHEGSVIEVDEGGRATLLLGKGSVFHLGGGTKFVVNRYGITRQSGEEIADLDLKFGKTRALILNQGGRRAIQIRSRSATMGVRGTEILIDAPRTEKDAVKFVTLEGLAELKMEGVAQPIPIEQNRGFSSEGSPIATKEVSDARTTMQSEGLAPGAPTSSEPLPPPPRTNGFGGLSDGNAAGGLPPVRLDPLQDRKFAPGVAPLFCNAVAGSCP